MKGILTILFLIPTMAHAQSKFLIGVTAGPVLNSYMFRQDQKSELFHFKGKLNWQAGLIGKYFLNNHFMVDVGVSVASKNFISVINSDYLNSINWGDPMLVSPDQTTVTQTFIEIPLSVSYFPWGMNNKYNIYFLLGATDSEKADSPRKAWQYQDHLISIKPGGGVMLDLGKNFVFASEFYSTIYTQSVGYTGNPFQLGLNFSVLKRLGKAN